MIKFKTFIFFLFVLSITSLPIKVEATEISTNKPQLTIAEDYDPSYKTPLDGDLNNNISQLYHEKETVVEVFNHENRTLYLTDKDINLMSQIVFAESKGEPYEGKVAVASVILNRAVSPGFPSTIEKVIKQKNAFSCVVNGKISVTPTKECYDAVMEAIKGYDPSNRALYFYNPKSSTCNWMKQIEKKNIKTIGRHVFFQI
ncbi:cell wall hydrolase [Clostridium fallax]|uniref:N-acetylmuramoyl-L-alanine amidase n=1 Tax=Clostridium fallax TaxID=1533 RepID=A0A1M4TUG2_9CLOT|nr:cell wall hydrolase [Clostridium fallax]SHE48092.1 N-acetylmuramoyl-L-alanine amidase [Clostridium fallax]SQB22389.1 spore-cortex-lytic enzyme, sleb [Clostridium fallax]